MAHGNIEIRGAPGDRAALLQADEIRGEALSVQAPEKLQELALRASDQARVMGDEEYIGRRGFSHKSS